MLAYVGYVHRKGVYWRKVTMLIAITKHTVSKVKHKHNRPVYDVRIIYTTYTRISVSFPIAQQPYILPWET